MIELSAEGLGKRYHRHWVFRKLDLQIQSGQRILITGSNGSGKSTLMRVLAGQTEPTEGKLKYNLKGKDIDPEFWYQQVSWAGPYHELYGDLTLREALGLHFSFKKPLIPAQDIARELSLEPHMDKMLRHFSSGMLHRAKVGMAIFSESQILMLDEATTNMDENNSRAILDLTFRYLGSRALLYASNNPTEFDAFESRIIMGE